MGARRVLSMDDMAVLMAHPWAGGVGRDRYNETTMVRLLKI
jgi:hypothetical protein